MQPQIKTTYCRLGYTIHNKLVSTRVVVHNILIHKKCHVLYIVCRQQNLFGVSKIVGYQVTRLNI